MNRLIMALLLLAAACTPKEQVSENPENLIGTWERVRWVNTEISDTTWVEQDPKIIFLKHLTPTHFTWLSFNTETQELNATGGGTYTYDGAIYSEDIVFFHPIGSSIQGQTIPFTVDFEDGLWHHVGYFQDIELDPELSEMVRGDTILIEEYWRRMDSEAENTQLTGTWELVSLKEHKDSMRLEVFPFMRYYKMVTPTHFNWVQVSIEDNEVYAEGGGTFSLDGNTYTENLKYHYPFQEALTGLSIPFQFRLDAEGRWIHKGIFVRPLIDSAGAEIGTDTVYIDEIWQKWEPENDM